MSLKTPRTQLFMKFEDHAANGETMSGLMIMLCIKFKEVKNSKNLGEVSRAAYGHRVWTSRTDIRQQLQKLLELLADIEGAAVCCGIFPPSLNWALASD